MKVLLILPTLLAVAYGNTQIPAGTPLTQCDPADIECPVISNIQVEDGFELRTYPVSKWVSHLYSGPNLDDFENSQDVSFDKLVSYISGENAAGMTIDMTTPVITHISPGSGPNCATNFTMSFFVPSELHSNAPEPTGQGVFLQDFSEMQVYVIAFDGFAETDVYINYALELQNNIRDSSLYYTDFYFFVGYNNPFDLFDRRNEVWFVAK